MLFPSTQQVSGDVFFPENGNDSYSVVSHMKATGNTACLTSTRERFTVDEWKTVCRYNTPFKVQQFLNALPYNNERTKETLRTFRGVIAHQSAHCLEGALSAAVILEQHGYPPVLLDLESQDHLDHVLLLYEKDGKWGTVARSRDPGLHGRKPVFLTVRELVESYAAPFIDFTGRVVGYGVYDLAGLGNYDWRLSARNVWHVQRALIEMPHRRYHMSNRKYRFWHDRYLAYKERYPHRKPLYFPNRGCWKPGYPKNR